jgi:hypothetical protein
MSGNPVEGERRRRHRAQVHWRLRFTEPCGNGELECVTRDLSSEGFYCVASAPLIPGEIHSCTLTVPTHNRNGGGPVVCVQCKARVVRVEAFPQNGTYGIGFRIEDYRFVGPG